MNLNSAVIAKIEMQAVAKPAPGDSIADLIRKVEAAGNEVLEVYEDGVLIGRYKTDLTVGGSDGG